MSQSDGGALEILNRRLASGEITPEQYDELASRVGKSVSKPLEIEKSPVDDSNIFNSPMLNIMMLGAATLLAMLTYKTGGIIFAIFILMMMGSLILIPISIIGAIAKKK